MIRMGAGAMAACLLAALAIPSAAGREWHSAPPAEADGVSAAPVAQSAKPEDRIRLAACGWNLFNCLFQPRDETSQRPPAEKSPGGAPPPAGGPVRAEPDGRPGAEPEPREPAASGPEKASPAGPPLQRAGRTADSKDGRCLKLEDIPDGDGDFQRNRDAVSSPDLCLAYDEFDEGGFHWILQIIHNAKRPGPLWAVPHDNENTAFDTAVYGVTMYGGTVVAVETNGNRELRGASGRSQDPNRNFDAGTGQRCPLQVAPSTEYTRRFFRWWSEGEPIIALHTNDRGYAGDGAGGKGGISIDKPLPGNIPFKAHRQINAKSPSDTLVFVASLARPDDDPSLKRFVDALTAEGVNVLYEVTSKQRNDCSMSNYAALRDIRGYVNVEVVHGDGPTQQHIVRLVMRLLKEVGIGAAPASRPDHGGPPVVSRPEPDGAVPRPDVAPLADENLPAAKPAKPGGPAKGRPARLAKQPGAAEPSKPRTAADPEERAPPTVGTDSTKASARKPAAKRDGTPEAKPAP